MGNHLGSTWPSITLLFLTGDLVTWTTWTSIYLSHKLLLLTTPWNWIIIFEVYRTIRGKLSSRVHFPPVKTLLESWMSESILLEFCIFCVYSLISEDWKSVIETALAFRSARMIVPGAVPPPWQVVDNFVRSFGDSLLIHRTSLLFTLYFLWCVSFSYASVVISPIEIPCIALCL